MRAPNQKSEAMNLERERIKDEAPFRQVCIWDIFGKCNRASCQRIHVEQQYYYQQLEEATTGVCPYYLITGKCLNGNSCPQKHDIQKVRRAITALEMKLKGKPRAQTPNT